MENSEEVTSRFSHVLFVLWFNAVCGGCLLLHSPDLGLLTVWGWKQSQAAVQLDHTGSLGTSFRILQESNTYLSFPAVLVSALMVYKLSKFHALIVLWKKRAHGRSQLCCAKETGHYVVHLFKADTDYILEDFRAATI